MANTDKSVEELREFYNKNHRQSEFFADVAKNIKNLRDVTKNSPRSISAINKEELKRYIENIGGNEKGLRTVAQYLYYRSNVLYRIVNFYADLWDLTCRKVVPRYDLIKDDGIDNYKESYFKTLDYLDVLNLQGNMTEALINVYNYDIYYGIRYTDDVGTFFYMLDPSECLVDSRYQTSDFGYSVDMSKWRNAQRQQIIEYLGSPLKEMYAEYQKTGIKWIHCDDKYAVCFKFRTDIWDTCIPPLLPTYLSLAALEDQVDNQALADELAIYKLVYYPMKVSKDSDGSINSFEIDPAVSHKYFSKLLSDALPENVAGAMVPGDELKTIDFSRTVDSDVTSVEKATNQVLQTAGGGAVLNANMITSTEAFKAWLRNETEFAQSTLLPQINGFANRVLLMEVGKDAAKVEHFPVSVYTKDDLAKQLLESCQYSFSNRLAYNTLLGISEKETIIMEKVESDMLGLTSIMNHPLASSYTSTGTEVGKVGQGAPEKDSGELTESGERDRNR